MINLVFYILFEAIFIYLLYKLFGLIRKRFIAYLVVLIITIVNLVIGIGSDILEYFYSDWLVLEKIDHASLINTVVTLLILFAFIFFKYKPKKLALSLIGIINILGFVFALIFVLDGITFDQLSSYLIIPSSVILVVLSVAIYYKYRQQGSLYFLFYLVIMILRGFTASYGEILPLVLSSIGYVVLTLAILKIGSNGNFIEDVEYVFGKGIARFLKIRSKIVASFLALISLTILVLGLFSYYIISQTIIDNSLNQLESVATIQEARINEVVDRNIERLKGVSSRTKLRQSLNSYNQENNEDDREIIRSIIIDARDSISDFEDVIIIGLDGQVVVNANSDLEGQDYYNLPLFAIGQNREHLHFDIEDDESKIYLHGPLLLDGELLGVVIITVNTNSVQAITKDYTGLGSTGETVLAKRNEQGDAQFMHQRRFEVDSNNLTVPKDRFDVPITQALLKNEFSYTDSVDYREEPVLAVTRYIEEVDWGLVVKVDRSELLIPVNDFRNSLILISSLLFILTVTTAYLIARSISKPIEKLGKEIKIIEKGDLDHKVGIQTYDEIGDFSRSFDNMTSAIKESYAQADRKVAEQTKEIRDKQSFMEEQQKAILNILEDVDEARGELNQKYIEVDVIKDLTQKLGLSINPLQIMDYLVLAIHKLYPDLIISHTELLVEAERASRVVHVHSPFKLTDECNDDLKEKTLKGFKKLPKNIKSKVKLKKWLDQDFDLKVFKEKNAPKAECFVEDDLSIIFMVPGVITSSVNISSMEKGAISENTKEAINIVFDNAKVMVGNVRDLVTSEHSRLEDLMESMTNGVLMFDVNGKVITANAAFTQMTGLPKEEIDLIDFLKFFKKNGKDFVSSVEEEVLEKGEVLHFDEIEMARFTYEIYIAPMRDYQNKISGGVIVLHDITQMKAVDKMKTEFVSVASHQLRTPLTAMNWFIEMLLSEDAGKLTEMQKNYLDEVYRGSSRMVKLVNDLLNVSRLETGRLKIQPKSTDLVKFIKDIIDEAKPLSRKKGCKILFNKPKKISKISIDPSLMRQVVHNLITNAIKYSKDKSCNIKVVLKKRKNDYLVSVTDSGIGISKEEQGRLFDKFFRADAAVQMAAEGTGLGLYIAKMVTEASGGKIWLDSVVGKGTTFYVTIPIKGMKKQEGEKGLA